jgi:predicted nuclease of predicted toxin-antitoxin system
MGISPLTVGFLRYGGHDALHLHEVALDSLADALILKKARAEGRILLTNDLDFGDLLAASGDALPSLAIFRLRSMVPDNVNRHLELLLAHHEFELEQGVAVSVAEDHIRIRRLPIE